MKSDGFKKYASNTFWMTFEKIIRLTINLFVGVWLARYLGPSEFGLLNFGIAIVTVFLPIVNFGLQGILVKELFDNPENKNTILGTSFVLKLVVSIIVVLLIFFSGFFYQLHLYSNDLEKNVVLLVSLSLLFQPFLVIDCWYESQANTKIPSILKTLFFVVVSVIKVLFILKQSSLVSFAVLYSVEGFFVAFAVLMAYLKDGGSVFKWTFSVVVLKDLTKKSWLLVFSSISAVIYLKIDQVMIGSMVSDEELGFYSAAVRFSEAWYFIPTIVLNALFPAILSAKNQGFEKYSLRLQQLCDFLFLGSFTLALVVTFVAKFVIILFYGIDYSASVVILQIHIWAAIFVFLRAVLSKWLIAEGKYKFSLISQLSGAIINVLLNLLLIPLYGGSGAAIATIISYSVASFFILGFFKETKPVFLFFVKSFVAPIRIIFNYEEYFKKN
ncbi:hypothetical protein BWZ22_06965 [Seonamhaeicola sp. S2-3]|uniref:flippase n=1 Tax=Seonamhaeicola sp. S2-3 TaxID=1936081 RepID=UPI000972839E|nr:flippase [Seonamhaeicola sp. S2-3]APY12788.1 hypothetical protein BWZ22_06965 [Seonamhaeicola sp. S2-3]